MKNANKLLILGTSFVLSFIVIVSLFFIFTSDDEEYDSRMEIEIYYQNRISKMLETETTIINKDREDIIEVIFERMKTAPKSQNLKSIIPQEVELLDFSLEKKLLDINISGEYNELSNADRIFLICGSILTFLDYSEIDGVKIFVESKELLHSTGNAMGYLNRTSIVKDTVIYPDKIQMQMATLYFSNGDNTLLLPESRTIYVKQSENVEAQIVEQLISGPKMIDYFSTVPTETKVNNIKTELGICYVDLNQNFISKQSAQSNPQIAIYSIVNSLTELEEVEKVQFLIEGRKVDYYNGISISNPMDRNEELIGSLNYASQEDNE